MKKANTNEQFLEVMQDYWNTYDCQGGWGKYIKKTLVNDALYGIGIALSDEYKGAEGFDKFLEELQAHIADRAAVRAG